MDDRPLFEPPRAATRVAAGLAAAVLGIVLLVALLHVPVDALNSATFARGGTEPARVVDVVTTGDGDERRVESVVETLPGVLLAYRDAHAPGTLLDVVTVPFGDRAYPPSGPGPPHGGSVPVAVACALAARPLVRTARGLAPPSTIGVRRLESVETVFGHACAGALGWMATSIASMAGLGWWAALAVAAGQLWLARRFSRARLEVTDERWTVRPVVGRRVEVELAAVTPGSLLVTEVGPQLHRRLAVSLPPRALDGDAVPADEPRDPAAIGWLAALRRRTIQPERWHGAEDLARRLLAADPTPSGGGTDRLHRLADSAVGAAAPTWPSSE